jgi:hypothetical protein
MGTWNYILAAYGVAAIAFGGYWWSVKRRIRRREVLLAEIGKGWDG